MDFYQSQVFIPKYLAFFHFSMPLCLSVRVFLC